MYGAPGCIDKWPRPTIFIAESINITSFLVQDLYKDSWIINHYTRWFNIAPWWFNVAPGDSMLHFGNPNDSSCNHLSLCSTLWNPDKIFNPSWSSKEGYKEINSNPADLTYLVYKDLTHEPWTFDHGTSTP